MFRMPPPQTPPVPVLADWETPGGQAQSAMPSSMPDLDALLAPHEPCAPTPLSLADYRSGLDTLTQQVDQHRRRTFQRFDILSRHVTSVLTDATMAADSRLSVVNELLSEVTPSVTDAGSARRCLQALRTADQLMDRLQKILMGRHPPDLEVLRYLCLRTAQRMRLAPVLDPDFLKRVVQVDLQPVDEALAIDVAQGHNPFQRFRPQFSCWKDAPVLPTLPPWSQPAQAMSDELLLELWERWTLAGMCLGPDAFQRFLHEPEARPGDVEPILDEWMALPTAEAVALMASPAKVVAVRVGTSAANRMFPGRADHELARYCPHTRTLVVGVKATPGPDSQERLNIPSTQLAHTDGRPSRFWMEVARMLVADWSDAARTEASTETPSVIPAGRWLERMTARCVSECEIELARGGFLEALAADADAGPLGFPLGASEEETHARVVARHLCGMPLPLALADYVSRRLQQT